MSSGKPQKNGIELRTLLSGLGAITRYIMDLKAPLNCSIEACPKCTRKSSSIGVAGSHFLEAEITIDPGTFPV